MTTKAELEKDSWNNEWEKVCQEYVACFPWWLRWYAQRQTNAATREIKQHMLQKQVESIARYLAS